MNYEYSNQFYWADNIASTTSSIISNKEGESYICRVLTVTIPEHKGLVYKSPLDGYVPYGGGLFALSGAQMRSIEEEYGKYVLGTVPAETYLYFAIMKEDKFNDFSKISFDNKEQINVILQSFSILYYEYKGIVDATKIIELFPYLESFFNQLDEWRSNTGRVTLDDDILNTSKKSVINKSRRRKRI